MNTVAETITIALDGQPHPLPVGATLAALIQQLGHPPHAVSTAVNGHFIARAARADHVLMAGDQVLLFQPIVGG